MSAGGGGAINALSAVDVESSVLSGNSTASGSQDGGAILVNGADLTIGGSTITGNTAALDGGGVMAVYGRLTITDSTISHNQATALSPGSAGVGGGFYDSYGGGPFTIHNPTFAYNAAGNYGGGIATAATNMTVIGSTVADNSSAYRGGGMDLAYLGGAGQVTLEDSVVAATTAATTPGGFPDIHLRFGATASAAYSLIGDPSGTALTSTGGNLVGSSGTPLDPQLGPLQDNGGSTKAMLPASDSPVVDAGKAFGLTTDQRGDTRPVDLAVPNASGGDGSDIGAVELQAGAPPAGGCSTGGGSTGGDLHGARVKASSLVRLGADRPLEVPPVAVQKGSGVDRSGSAACSHRDQAGARSPAPRPGRLLPPECGLAPRVGDTRLSLAGLRPGMDRLRFVFTYTRTKTVHHHRRVLTVRRTVVVRRKVC